MSEKKFGHLSGGVDFLDYALQKVLDGGNRAPLGRPDLGSRVAEVV